MTFFGHSYCLGGRNKLLTDKNDHCRNVGMSELKSGVYVMKVYRKAILKHIAKTDLGEWTSFQSVAYFELTL
ncbi:MAG TPA: hypothetical protein DCL77_07130 [Prolixibacteraceae bacterium]|jgi:hypothetical protein|nr:hypothetical protein [Prolixibacteraceae bacterium]